MRRRSTRRPSQQMSDDDIDRYIIGNLISRHKVGHVGGSLAVTMIIMYHRSSRRALFMCIAIFTVALFESKTFHVEALCCSRNSQQRQQSISILPQHSPLYSRRYYVSSLRRRKRRRRSQNSDSDTRRYSSVSAADKNDPLIVTTASHDDVDASNTTIEVSASSSNCNKEAPSKSYEYVVPSYQTLLLFCSTTILIWLSEPLLSLVDTTVVGHTGGPAAVLQLAAMGPATTLIDGLLYTTYFLALATTNLIARALAKGDDYRTLLTTTSHVLGVAAVLGCIVTAVIFTAGPTMIARMVGTQTAAASPQLVHYAVRYCQIRGLAAVCSVWQMVGQSFCLTVQDTRTPALAVVVASVTNIAGDLLLRRQGMQGAAVATAVAVSASAAILLSQVWRQVKMWRVLLVEQEEEEQANKQRQQERTTALMSNVDQPFPAQATSQSSTLIKVNMTQAFESASAIVSTEIQTTGPAGSPAVIPFMSLPDHESLVELVGLSGPLFFNMMGKIICYSALTLRCTAYGVIPLAAHTIMMRFFFLYGCFGYSIGQTAQAFLPAAVYPAENKTAVRRILRRLATLAAVVAISNSLLVAWNVRTLGRFLTADAAVVQAMRDHAVYLGAAIFLHPFIELTEGVVIATRQFRTLISTYVVTVAAHLATLLCLCRSFTGVWQALVGFQVVRLTNFSLRAWNKRRMAGNPVGSSTARQNAIQ